MEKIHYYDTKIEWKKDRIGIISSTVLPQEIEVATPPEFPKGISRIWSPEHLFVAACNTCLMTTFLAIAENSGLVFESFKSEAKGKLETIEGKMLISEITLRPEVVITNHIDQEKALRILMKSEANCLISNSMKSTIVFEPTIIVNEKVNAN